MSAPRDSETLTPVVVLVREGWRRLQAQSPQAAWAAWQEALRLEPSNVAARQALEGLAVAVDLPAAARRVYRFRSPNAQARADWDARLRQAQGNDVESARTAFVGIVADRPEDAGAWFNLGLCLAWSDRNADAVAALMRAASLSAAIGDTSVEHAAEACTLAEIVRHGAGAEMLADDLRCALTLAWTDDLGDPVETLHRLGPHRVLAGAAAAEGGTGFGATARGLVEWLDRPMPSPESIGIGLDPSELPRVRATMIEEPGELVFHALSPEVLRAIEQQIAYLLGWRFRPLDRRTSPLPLHLLDSAAWQFRLPEWLTPEKRADLSRRAVEHWYRDAWVRLPRIGLASQPGIARSPLSAAIDLMIGTDPAARGRLEGIIRVREELASRPAIVAHAGRIDFDGLRQKLRLEPPREIGPGAGASATDLDPNTLSCDNLFTLWRDSIALDEVSRWAESLATRFPDRLWEPRLRPVAESVLRTMLQSHGPEAVNDWLERWTDAARDDDSRALVERLAAEVALAAFGDEEAAARRLAVLANGPSEDPGLLADVAGTLSELGDHENATIALSRALAAAERAGDLSLSARLWDELGRPLRDDIGT